ncbi:MULTISPECIES: CPBP family intramembrane glutamic endopeptidase [unclassified Moraxella]|uniref:CPBP family intramembrane glutamic endopeptidase n=1 Tax=unclassified Moraxella TaxID=2685852 RepID=UPI003AF6B2D4
MTQLSNTRSSSLKNNLTFSDIFILSVIFFAYPIISSSYAFFTSVLSNEGLGEVARFDSQSTYLAIVIELITLAIAFGYLRYRKFNYKSLPIYLDIKVPLQMILLVIGAGLVADLLQYFEYWYLWINEPDLTSNPTLLEQSNTMIDDHSNLSVSFAILSLLNGFYEEIFFMGLVFAVSRDKLTLAIAYSLVIRFLFHTYQGLFSAVIILSLGIVFLIARKYLKNLVPFFLAHAIFDMFGMGLLIHFMNYQ